MDASFPDLIPLSEDAKFLGVPNQDRWKLLKPILIRLFTTPRPQGGRPATMQQMVEFMKRHYSFHATPPEYRTHFKAWGVDKNTSTQRKTQVTKALMRRARSQPTTAASDVSIRQSGSDKPLDATQWRRYMRDQLKKLTPQPLAPSVLTSFFAPYNAYLRCLPQLLEAPNSAPQSGAPTPDSMTIDSPEATTPGRTVAISGPSADMQLVMQTTKAERTLLFVQGDFMDLAMQVSLKDRRTLVDWGHDLFLRWFWMAKHWSLDGISNTPSSSSSQEFPPITPSPVYLDSSSSASAALNTATLNRLRPPTMLCRWTIHVPHEALWDEGAANYDDSASSAVSEVATLLALLQQTVKDETFTHTPMNELPIGKDVLLDSMSKAPGALAIDSWKLAIMTGNVDLLYQLDRERKHNTLDGINEIYPFHLAAAFLNGGKSCCLTFSTLIELLGSGYPFHHNVNNLGHTILDSFLITILRAHTTVPSTSIHPDFYGRFPGEDQDVCGRWDHESPAIQDLLRAGHSSIPADWKHPFCHSSVQAVCHGIFVIFGSPASPRANAPSGLFSRLCDVCGVQLQLGPLHSLVIVASLLAEKGRPGETLFGVLAMLMTFLRVGVDPSLSVECSLESIFGTKADGLCHHRRQTPVQLMESFNPSRIESWSSGCQFGWATFQKVLGQAQREESEAHRQLWRCGGSVAHSCLRLTCCSSDQGLLWAAIQTEMLTYRRLSEGDRWISPNFSMPALQHWVSGRHAWFDSPLYTDSMMRNHTKCGWFINDRCGPSFFPTARQVSKNHFMNMDDYTRANFVPPQGIMDIWSETESFREGDEDKER